MSVSVCHRPISTRSRALALAACVAVSATATLMPFGNAAAQTAVCYNCPPEWAEIGRAHV